MSSNWPILSWMIITLPIGAGLIWLTPHARFARGIALTTALIDLALSLVVIARFDPALADFQFIEQTVWIPGLNIHYRLGVDGISVLFPAFTVLLFIAVIMASWKSVQQMVRLYYSLLLLLESATLGIFCALDTVLFFLFWELTLIPLFFLISLWGTGPHRRYAAIKYTLFMLAAGVPLLFGFILLAFNYADYHSLTLPQGLMFDYITLLKTPVPPELQVTILVLLATGFAVKTPLFPFHTWLPTATLEGPASVAALMTGLKLGAYGVIRFVAPMAPDAMKQYHMVFITLGVIGMIYGAVIALSQTNLRRMLAYASLSHVGLVMVGIASLNAHGLNGAVFQLLNFSMITGGLFLLTGFIHQRTGSTDLMSLGGLAHRMPLLSAFFLILVLASLGVPGGSGFIAEFLLIYGAFKVSLGAGITSLLVIILGAAYLIYHYRKTFFGPLEHAALVHCSDLTRRELFIAVGLTLMVLVLGVYPAAVLDLLDASTAGWLVRISPR